MFSFFFFSLVKVLKSVSLDKTPSLNGSVNTEKALLHPTAQPKGEVNTGCFSTEALTNFLWVHMKDKT